MKYFIVIIFILVPSIASACKDSQVEYEFRTFGGSEFEFVLQIQDNKFQITYRAWEPGEYDNASVESFSGTVRYDGENIDFYIDQEEVAKAKLIEIGFNPLSLPEDTKAIFFKSSNLHLGLEGQLLYLRNGRTRK